MKSLHTLLFLFISCWISAQTTIPNGGFENWTSFTYEEPDNYFTDAARMFSNLDTTTASKSSDAFSGNYSILLETMVDGSDTLFGFFTAGDFETSNGFPFSQSPDSIAGYYKSDIKVGDTAIVVVRFSNAGTIFFDQTVTVTGTQSSWKRLSFPLNLSMTPDSMFIAVASSNAINEVGVTPGSWIKLDSIHLIGAGITQKIPNESFENWTAETYETPDSWFTFNSGTSSQKIYTVTKTTDSEVGSFALRLETIEVFDDTLSLMFNGKLAEDTITGGIPFTATSDTLVGFYKYSPIGTDTAAMSISFIKNDTVLDRKFQIFSSQTNYTQFEIPFDLSQTPDTALIVITSSVDEKFVGSVLLIDDLRLKSIITSLNKNITEIEELKVYPNPTVEQLTVKFKPLEFNTTFTIIDAIGRTFKLVNSTKGVTSIDFDVSSLPNGTYYLRFESNGNLTHRAFIKN